MTLALFCLMEEGYSFDFEPQYGNKNRTTILKSGIEVKLFEVKSIFKNHQALKDIRDYKRWKKLGFSRANWEECDNRLIEMVETLKEYDDFYRALDGRNQKGMI